LRTTNRWRAEVCVNCSPQFALNAFEAQALDYLLKPVSESRFGAMMKRLSAHLRTKASNEAGLVVTTTQGMTVVPVREVDWLEAADNYARIWSGKRSFLIREPLDQLEKRLGSDGFLRVHRRRSCPRHQFGNFSREDRFWC
jgi:two-component system LytT family response regulator